MYVVLHNVVPRAVWGQHFSWHLYPGKFEPEPLISKVPAHDSVQEHWFLALIIHPHRTQSDDFCGDDSAVTSAVTCLGRPIQPQKRRT